jgi:hypothetical protein
MAQPEKAELVRCIGRWDLVALAVNAVIGAGIFGLPSKVQSLIGPYSLIAFIVCAVVVTLIILCFAEVGSRFSVTGGPYLYAREAFGPVVGFEVGWLVWLARLTAPILNGNYTEWVEITDHSGAVLQRLVRLLVATTITYNIAEAVVAIAPRRVARPRSTLLWQIRGFSQETAGQCVGDVGDLNPSPRLA